MGSHSVCAVFSCKNTGRNNKQVMFHAFPKDKQRQKEWTIRCKRKDKINVKTARVCSAHFLPEDYERDLKSELLGLPVKKRLKLNVVPSQCIPNWHAQNISATKSERERRHDKREVIKRAFSTLENLSPNKKPRLDETACSETICTTNEKEIKELREELERVKFQYKQEIEDLKHRNASLLKSNIALKKTNSTLRSLLWQRSAVTDHTYTKAAKQPKVTSCVVICRS